MECYSCPGIAYFKLLVNGNIDSTFNAKVGNVSMCCRRDLIHDVDGSEMNFPTSKIYSSPKETLEHFFTMRASVIAKGKWGG